jgi:hypothetical protein
MICQMLNLDFEKWWHFSGIVFDDLLEIPGACLVCSNMEASGCTYASHTERERGRGGCACCVLCSCHKQEMLKWGDSYEQIIPKEGDAEPDE